jgi:hypothetical protein
MVNVAVDFSSKRKKLSEVEMVLYKILEITISRIEFIVIKLEKATENINDR